jgi:hypothetical protein
MKSSPLQWIHSKSFFTFCPNSATKFPEYPINGCYLNTLAMGLKGEKAFICGHFGSIPEKFS